MPRAGFEAWLARRYSDGSTVRARLSNVVRLESAYGAIEDHYRRDRCAAIFATLAYSAGDAARAARNPSRIPLEPTADLRNGLSTLRGALKLYVGFLDECAGRNAGLVRRARPRPGAQRELPFPRGAAGPPDLPPPVGPSPDAARGPNAAAEPSDPVTALMRRYAGIERDLRSLGVIRTANVLGDYAEWLCARAFGWALTPSSEGHFDARDADGRRIQIKARRISIRAPSRELSALRRLNEDGFDALVGVLFDADYAVMRAALIPRDVVAAQSAYVRHTNAWRFMLVDTVFAIPEVADITAPLRAAQGLGATDAPRSGDA